MQHLSPRLQTFGGFLTSAVALAFVTLFIMVDLLRPLLEGAPPAALAPLVAEVYPFPTVTEVRIGYCAVALIPVLLPLIASARWAAWATIILGAIVTLLNVEDAMSGYVLDGRPALGLLFMVAVLLPTTVGLVGAWRWIRAAKRQDA